MGPAVQDFWMLLSGDPQQRQSQLNALLDGYESIMEFDWRELKLIEALRALRMIHHSAWLAKRWHDPAFPAAFPWFAQGSYWQQQTDLLRQQIEVLQEQAQAPQWP
jgi:Ser/Thr protein kinase RdoA (MazF antagonist)